MAVLAVSYNIMTESESNLNNFRKNRKNVKENKRRKGFPFRLLIIYMLWGGHHMYAPGGESVPRKRSGAAISLQTGFSIRQ